MNRIIGSKIPTVQLSRPKIQRVVNPKSEYQDLGEINPLQRCAMRIDVIVHSYWSTGEGGVTLQYIQPESCNTAKISGL